MSARASDTQQHTRNHHSDDVSASGNQILELEAFLPYRISVLAETVSQALGRMYRQRCGIAVPEWRILVTLGQFGRMTAKDVGRHSHMHKTKVSRAVASMEQRGLVYRRSNSADLRESFLELTPSGRDIYDNLIPEARAFADAMLAEFSEDERADIERFIERLGKRARLLNTSAANDEE